MKEKIERKEEKTSGERGVLERRPYTQKEKDGFYEGFDATDKVKEVLGYKPESKKVKRLEIVLLEQLVEELNLVEVIKAINNIK